MNIALVTPKNKEDYLVNTVLDGFLQLNTEDSYPRSHLGLPSDYPTYLQIDTWRMSKSEFLTFARIADLIIVFWGKDNTDCETAEEINRWDKTVFVDGSELGGNRRYDREIERKVIEGTYTGRGAIDTRMLEKCALYFRREKPYIHGIIPMPFGIESRYTSHYSADKKKDIDFVCIFGQDEYPPLRREVRAYLEDFAKKSHPPFVCATQHTKGFSLSGSKIAGRDEFYNILSRSKVGISVGGGGFDTARFWEILGNNCMLLTETIDIYEPESTAFDYKRIWQFKDMDDFKIQLAKMADHLKNEYDQDDMMDEYHKIIDQHSSKARVMTILREAKKI